MRLFGKKDEPNSGDEDVVSDVDEIIKAVDAPAPIKKVQDEEREEEPEEVENKQNATSRDESYDRPSFAPLFVKIDRYRNILSALGYLKTTIVMVRNSFATLNELEKARSETMKLIHHALEKVDKKLSTLDSELIRPSGYHEPPSATSYEEVAGVESSIADLKGQIDQLKAELEHMS